MLAYVSAKTTFVKAWTYPIYEADKFDVSQIFPNFQRDDPAKTLASIVKNLAKPRILRDKMA